MALVKASLKLFGGDTVVVRCSERCHIHLMSEKNHVKDTQSDILSVQDRDNAWLTEPDAANRKAGCHNNDHTYDHNSRLLHQLAKLVFDSRRIQAFKISRCHFYKIQKQRCRRAVRRKAC